MPIPIVAALLPWLAEQGLGLLKGAVEAKGKEVVEDLIGVKLPEKKEDFTPELAAQLRIREMENEERLLELSIKKQELDLKETEAFLEDRGNARDRDKEFVKAGRNNTRGDILAYMAVGALVLDGLFLSFWEVPKANRDLLLVILGALIAIVKDVYGFEFGSSKDSQRNAQAVADKLRNA